MTGHMVMTFNAANGDVVCEAAGQKRAAYHSPKADDTHDCLLMARLRHAGQLRAVNDSPYADDTHDCCRLAVLLVRLQGSSLLAGIS